MSNQATVTATAHFRRPSRFVLLKSECSTNVVRLLAKYVRKVAIKSHVFVEKRQTSSKYENFDIEIDDRAEL